MEDHNSTFWPIFMTVISLVFMAGFVIFIALGIMALTLPQHYEFDSQQELVSMRSVDGVSGSFFLGSGHIGTVGYYFYYSPYHGGLRNYKVETSKSVIFEGERDNPRLEIYKAVFDDFPKIYNFAERYEYRFYIPEGSIDRTFRLE